MSSKTLIAELDFEKISTLKLLERLPEDKLTWKPHPKAMTLGQLAFHVAAIPGRYAGFAEEGRTKAEILIEHPESNSKHDILAQFHSSIERAKSILDAADDKWDSVEWKCTWGEKEIIKWPRPVVLRFLMMNHLCHHRGQLVTYLRTLGVLIPSIYGPSGDENPFL